MQLKNRKSKIWNISTKNVVFWTGLVVPNSKKLKKISNVANSETELKDDSESGLLSDSKNMDQDYIQVILKVAPCSAPTFDCCWEYRLEVQNAESNSKKVKKKKHRKRLWYS